MRRLTLEILAAIAITLAALIASLHTAMAGDLTVTGAFARASTSPGATTGVVYLTITNTSADIDTLAAIATPAAGMAMVHESKDEGGNATMAPVMALEIPAASSVTLKPGGLHIMLMDMKAPLKQGATVHLDLTFARAGQIGIDVPIKGIAAMAP